MSAVAFSKQQLSIPAKMLHSSHAVSFFGLRQDVCALSLVQKVVEFQPRENNNTFSSPVKPPSLYMAIPRFVWTHTAVESWDFEPSA